MCSLGDWPGELATFALVEGSVVAPRNHYTIRTLIRRRDC